MDRLDVRYTFIDAKDWRMLVPWVSLCEIVTISVVTIIIVIVFPHIFVWGSYFWGSPAPSSPPPSPPGSPPPLLLLSSFSAILMVTHAISLITH